MTGQRIGTWLVLSLALVLRVAWALWIEVEPQSDGVMYHEFALSLVQGRGYAYPNGALTAYWPVGTSALYAGLYRAFGVGFAPIVAFNLLLGLLVVALTMALAAHWFDRRAALFAGLIAACWPLLIQFTTVLASELLFTALCLASLALQTLRAPSAGRDVGTGLLLAAACLVRPTALALFVFFLVFGWLAERRWTGVLRQAFLFGLAAIVVIGPWAWRNTLLFGSPVLISANFGANLWMGNSAGSNGGYQPLPEDRAFASEVDRDRHFKALALDYIRAEPARYVRMSLKRFVDTHSRETIGVSWNRSALDQRLDHRGLHVLKLLTSAYWWLAATAAMVGAWSLLRRDRAIGLLHPLILLPAFTAAVPTLTVSQDRYHFPMIPMVAILASVAWAALARNSATAHPT
jgi:4-amino-4-deoxy-L-arabinose transferase-like glycosyltransferase